MKVLNRASWLLFSSIFSLVSPQNCDRDVAFNLVLQILANWCKNGKNPGVIKERFYMTTSLSDSWGAFTPPHAGVTLGRLLH